METCPACPSSSSRPSRPPAYSPDLLFLTFSISLLHASTSHSFKTLRGPFTTMSRLISLFLFLWYLQKCLAATPASQCYYPNGEKSDDSPCDPDADESVCCGGSFGSVCLSNKLCLGSNGNNIRGSCTDKNWEAPECAMFCLGRSNGSTSGPRGRTDVTKAPTREEPT